MKRLISHIGSVTLLIATPLIMWAAPNQLPGGNPITFDFIDYLAAVLLNFIIGLSMTLMVASIVISGIMIMWARDNPTRLKNGLAMLKTAIYGSAIVMGSGVIINTVWAIVTRDFFCQFSILGICIFK